MRDQALFLSMLKNPAAVEDTWYNPDRRLSRRRSWASLTCLSFDDFGVRLVLNGVQPTMIKIAVTVGIMP